MKMLLLVIESTGAALFAWYLMLATDTIQFNLGEWKVNRGKDMWFKRYW